jgi:sigma-B regulation protein RsbU (phosphoserine phosphatase)
MKLRSKFFLILLVFSLLPLGALAFVSHRAMNRMGAVMSRDVHQELSRSASVGLKAAAESSALILAKNRQAVEFALASLASEAEVLLAEESIASTKVYFAADFDEPGSEPPDFGPRSGYVRMSADGRILEEFVSLNHPVFLLAPGTSAADVTEDIDRLSVLAPSFADIALRMAPTLHWLYVSLENGVHISYPGHGGYPAGYDPRQRPWYTDAADEIRWTPPLIDATSGRVIVTASKLIRHADGSPAGVAAMDLLITEVLRVEALSAMWSTAMRSFLVAPVKEPASEITNLLILAQKDHQIPALPWAHGANPERLSSDEPQRMALLIDELRRGRSGYLEMQFKGTDSTWAFAPLDEQLWFVVVVPKSVLDQLPQRTLRIVQKYTNEELLIKAAAAAGAILLAVLAAFLGSRSFTRPMYELVDATARLSRGDFSVRLQPQTGDERDQVMQAFNEMVPKLQDHLRMHESLRLATEVQQNLLPQAEPSLPGLDIAGLSLYCDETGGDYYDYLAVCEDPLGAVAVVVGDVSGHGAHAALLMASARAALRLRASLPGRPAQIIADVNRQFTADVESSGAFMTLFYLAIDSTGRKARWVRAGHDPAILYDPVSKSIDELGGQGFALGIRDDAVFEENELTHLRPGQIIFIGTDGIWETAGPEGRWFGKDALCELIRANSERSARDIAKAIIDALETFREGLKPLDDITMVVVKIV